jgi:hypothetical protein
VPIGTHECLDIRGTLVRLLLQTSSARADPSILQLLFSRLPLWAARIVEAPVAEEGGSIDFTFEVKLSELRM